MLIRAARHYEAAAALLVRETVMHYVNQHVNFDRSQVQAYSADKVSLLIALPFLAQHATVTQYALKHLVAVCVSHK